MPPMANVSTRPARTTFACAECGHESLKWLGRCPGCASWNTFAEVLPAPRSAATARREGPRTAPVELSSLTGADEPRQPSGLPEFDRVLGGGIVAGSLVLVGGEPGVGKSTLLLQVAAGIAGPGDRVLYATGEESASQVHLRASRLGLIAGAAGESIDVLATGEIGTIVDHARSTRPAL